MQHYRWDFIGLSTDTKPTPENSEKVVDGSTYYCSDTSKLYVYCKDNWYEKVVEGGGGGTSYTAGDGIDITNDVISNSEVLTLNFADYNPDNESEPSTIFPEWLIENGIKAGQTIKLMGNPEHEGEGCVFNMGEDSETGDPVFVTMSNQFPYFTLYVTNFNQDAVEDNYKYLTIELNLGFIIEEDVPFIWDWEINDDEEPGVFKYYWHEHTSGGGSYTAGDGINITNDVISATNTGKAKELTSADYNYDPLNTGTNTAIALWLLGSGTYKLVESSVRIYYNTSSNEAPSNPGRTFTILQSSASALATIISASESPTSGVPVYVTRNNGQSATYFYIKQAVQSTGTSTTDVMSQNATTSMVFADPSTKEKVQIGASAQASVTSATAIGSGSKCTGSYGTALGYSAICSGQESVSCGSGALVTSSSKAAVSIGAGSNAQAQYAVSLGSFSNATQKGQMDISTTKTTNTYGYNNSQYRLITGVYDGQSNHDAATVAQGNKLMTTAPTTTDAGVLGQLWTDTTAMHTYQLTAIDTTDPDNPVYTWSQRW